MDQRLIGARGPTAAGGEHGEYPAVELVEPGRHPYRYLPTGGLQQLNGAALVEPQDVTHRAVHRLLPGGREPGLQDAERVQRLASESGSAFGCGRERTASGGDRVELVGGEPE